MVVTMQLQWANGCDCDQASMSFMCYVLRFGAAADYLRLGWDEYREDWSESNMQPASVCILIYIFLFPVFFFFIRVVWTGERKNFEASRPVRLLFNSPGITPF